MDRFKENLIFEMYKDKSIRSAYTLRNELIKKYDVDIKETTRLYAKIVNYQINKYSCKLNGSIIDSITNKNINARMRKYDNRKYHGLKEV